jgi:hypothetical protein
VNGTIVLTKELDFEKQTMYTLTVFAVVSVKEASPGGTFLSYSRILVIRASFVETVEQREFGVGKTVHNWRMIGQK